VSIVSRQRSEEQLRSAAERGGSTEVAPNAVQADRGGRRLGLAANLSALAASQAITWSLTLLWTLVVPRWIGPAGMGLIATATSVTAILGLGLALPTRDFLVREMAARPDAGPGLVGAAMLYRAGMAPVFFAAVAVYATFARLGQAGTAVLYLTTASTLFYLLTEPALAAFQATERMQYLAYNDVLTKAFVSLGGIALAVRGVQVVGLTLFGLLVAGGSFGLAAVWARRMISIDLRQGLRRTASVVRASLPYWAFGVFFMVYLWIDTVMLGLLAPPEVVGYYGVATKLFTTLMFVPFIVATACLPRLAAAFEEGWPRLGAVARAPVELVIVLSLPVCVGAAMTAGDAIPMLYGHRFNDAVPVMVILALCVPPMYLNVMLNQVLVAAKRPMVWTYLMIGATVVNPVVNLVLIKYAQARWHNGAIGAAISLLVTELLIVAAGIVIVGRHVLTGSSLWRLLRAVVAAAAMAGAMYAFSERSILPARSFLPAQSFFLLEAAVGLATFAGAAVLLRVVAEEERQLFRSLATQMLHRVRRRRGAGART
jgi:PST family polysaccharide transporter